MDHPLPDLSARWSSMNRFPIDTSACHWASHTVCHWLRQCIALDRLGLHAGRASATRAIDMILRLMTLRLTHLCVALLNWSGFRLSRGDEIHDAQVPLPPEEAAADHAGAGGLPRHAVRRASRTSSSRSGSASTIAAGCGSRRPTTIPITAPSRAIASSFWRTPTAMVVTTSGRSSMTG